MSNVSSSPDRSQAIADVQAVLDALYAAWADNDAEAFVAHYRDDATVVMPGVFHRGRREIRDYMAAGFDGPLRGSRGVDHPKDIRLFGDDTAVVVSTAGILLAEDLTLPRERERLATWVLTRQDGTWQIAAYANAPAH